MFLVTHDLDSLNAICDRVAVLADRKVFSEITGTFSDATLQITRFTDRLDSIGAAVETTLERADTALASAQLAFGAAELTLSRSGDAIEKVEDTFTRADAILSDQVPLILEQVSEAVILMSETILDLRNRTGETLEGYAATAILLNARLAELETTLRGAEIAFAAVTDASHSFDELVDGDGTLLVVEAREILTRAGSAIATLEVVINEDVPSVVTNIREGVATAAAAVDQVAADLTGLTGRFAPLATETEQTIASANALLERAQRSLDALDGAMTGAESALASAEVAFDAASGLMEIDIVPVLADIRLTSERIGVTVEAVARDAPMIATDLQALIARADAVVAQVQQEVAVRAPGVGDFANTGLRELTRLVQEARTLV